jgi:hypothetical protein
MTTGVARRVVDLAEKSLACARAGQLQTQNLDRDLGSTLQVIGDENDARPAASRLADEAILLRKGVLEGLQLSSEQGGARWWVLYTTRRSQTLASRSLSLAENFARVPIGRHTGADIVACDQPGGSIRRSG